MPRPSVRAGCVCTRCAAAIHEKPGRPPSFRLRYSTEEGWVSRIPVAGTRETRRPLVCGQGLDAAVAHAEAAPPPTTARDAYQRFIGGELREPQRLRIERDGQWWRVVDIERAAR